MYTGTMFRSIRNMDADSFSRTTTSSMSCWSRYVQLEYMHVDMPRNNHVCSNDKNNGSDSNNCNSDAKTSNTHICAYSYSHSYSHSEQFDCTSTSTTNFHVMCSDTTA